MGNIKHADIVSNSVMLFYLRTIVKWHIPTMKINHLGI